MYKIQAISRWFEDPQQPVMLSWQQPTPPTLEIHPTLFLATAPVLKTWDRYFRSSNFGQIDQ